MSQINPWTDKEIEFIKKLWTKGFTGSQIAARANHAFSTNRTRNSVIAKLDRLGMLKIHDSRQQATWVGRKSQNVKPDGTRRVANVVTLVIPPANEPEPPAASQTILVNRDGKLHANDHLTDACCRWPMGQGPNFSFCGRTADLGPYCHEHRAVAYIGVPVALRVEEKEKALA